MSWSGPGYRRTLDFRHLKGKKCTKCQKLYFSSRNYCGKCGREGNLEEVGLPKTAEVYSSSVVRSSTSMLQFDKKVPYTVGVLEFNAENNIRIPGIIDSDERLTGERVRAEIGYLGQSEKVKFHSYIWRELEDFHSPEPQTDSSDVNEGIGIVDYGVYVPRKRIKSEEIGKVWGEDVKGMVKSFPGKWDDQASYAMNSALNCLKNVDIDPELIGKVFVGSESHVYAVKPTATLVAELIGSHNQAADFEFACKAGTQALIEAYDGVKAGMNEYGLAIGADSAQSEPGDTLKYAAADAGVSFLVGKDKPIAIINGYESYNSDTPDFLRSETDEFPVHFGRYTGEPSYFKHIRKAGEKLMDKMGTAPEDYDYVVFHQPTPKFPRKMARKLGFTKEQLEPGIVVDYIGNSYSACTPLGLARILDSAAPGERIFVVSYGSGAGSDSFDITVTEHITEKQRQKERSVNSWLGIEDEHLLEFESYGIYAKNKGLLKSE